VLATQTAEPLDVAGALDEGVTAVPLEPTATPAVVVPVVAENEVLLDIDGSAEVNITSDLSAPFYMGEVIRVSGLAQLDGEQTMEAALISFDGQLLAAERITVGELNTWEANLTIPNQLSGQARVLVGIANADGRMAALEEQIVTIIPRVEREERYLLLDQPDGMSIASAGYYFYFSGRAERPARNLVVIEIRTDQCRVSESKHNLVLNGSGAWEGFVQVPANVTADEGCAMAYFGAEDAPERRMFQWMVPLQAQEDRQPALFVARPRANSEVQAGQTVLVYGTAAHAANNEVRLSMTTADGTVVTTETAAVDRFGYWEVRVLLPVSIAGEVELKAAVGRGADEASQVMIINVLDD